jgi:hypothetical protein
MGQVDFSLPVIGVGTSTDLLISDHAPQYLHQEVFVAALCALSADLDLHGLQPGQQVRRDEQSSLVPPSFQALLVFQTSLRTTANTLLLQVRARWRLESWH